MALRPPTDDDLRRLAEANHFQLNDEEVEGFQAIIPGFSTPTSNWTACRSPKNR